MAQSLNVGCMTENVEKEVGSGFIEKIKLQLQVFDIGINKPPQINKNYLKQQYNN